MIFQKLYSFLWQRNFEIIFAALCFYLYELQKLSEIFKILFQKGDINSFVLLGVFFSRFVQLKSSFSAENNISDGIWDIVL